VEKERLAEEIRLETARIKKEKAEMERLLAEEKALKEEREMLE
jgi:hypothetical protein